MKILFCVNSGGLGHAIRSLAIAEALKIKISGLHFEIISGNSSAELFRKQHYKVNDLYSFVPYTIIDGKMRLHSLWFIRYALRYLKEKRLAKGIVEKFKPDLILSDQDLAVIPAAVQRSIPIIYITDILGVAFAQNSVSQAWENYLNTSLTKLINSCDLVLMPVSGKSKGKIRRLGPLARETPKNRTELRSEFGFTRKTVLITGGGSEYGKFIVEKAVEAAQKVPDVDIIIVRGPELREKNYAAPNIRDLGTVENLHEYIYAADVVITTAGRSTISECQIYGTPFIALPIGNHFEQVPHALQYGFKFEDIYNLQTLIEQKLIEPRSGRKNSSLEKFANVIANFAAAV